MPRVVARWCVVVLLGACSQDEPRPKVDGEPTPAAPSARKGEAAPKTAPDLCRNETVTLAGWLKSIEAEQAQLEFDLSERTPTGTGAPAIDAAVTVRLDARDARVVAPTDGGDTSVLGTIEELERLGSESAPEAAVKPVRDRFYDHRSRSFYPPGTAIYVHADHDVPWAAVRGVLRAVSGGEIDVVDFVVRGPRPSDKPTGAGEVTGFASLEALSAAVESCPAARDLVRTAAEEQSAEYLAQELAGGLPQALLGCECNVDPDQVRRTVWAILGRPDEIALQSPVRIERALQSALPPSTKWGEALDQL